MFQKKSLVALMIVFVFLLLLPRPGYAHLVELLSSVPGNGAIIAQSPTKVEAAFNEEMQTEASTLQVFNAQGKQVDQGNGGVNLNDPDHASMVASLSPLPDGAYTVIWRVVLLDGDATTGSFNFFVGDETAATAADFAPISPSNQSQAGEVDVSPNNTVWLIAGIVVTALIIIVPVVLFLRRSS